jgi:hypothetical protein
MGDDQEATPPPPLNIADASLIKINDAAGRYDYDTFRQGRFSLPAINRFG